MFQSENVSTFGMALHSRFGYPLPSLVPSSARLISHSALLSFHPQHCRSSSSALLRHRVLRENAKPLPHRDAGGHPAAPLGRWKGHAAEKQSRGFDGISKGIEMMLSKSIIINKHKLNSSQTLALRVSIHCQGCKKKVKKVLMRVEGVCKCDIDGRSNKATVAVTGKVSADTLIRKLRRAGKYAEQWPEEQPEQQEQPSGAQCLEETKNQVAEPDGGVQAEKPASGDAAEPSDPKVFSPEEPNKSAGEAAPPAEDGTESTNDNASGSAGDGEETGAAQQPGEPKRKRKQQPQQQLLLQEEKAGEAIMATAALTQGSHTSHFPAAPLHLHSQQLPPVHAMSYNVVRPSASAAFYAAADAPASAAARPPPPPLPPPPQDHSYLYSQPSPYRYSYYHHYNGGHAASPARNSYVDLFSDENANACSVM
ncbi:hypothetical protein GUJ93_ZPchr0010g9521 [Zizania palustris]|uniref:HMA domain-containing protein n=1 Tax=Zizania palustris TaxID=103762 RepID=A0A8J5WBU9_ZIZPA|nr:hypothetical protein GUJ93_ZPchr0010g9521 [Zizania palustris]